MLILLNGLNGMCFGLMRELCQRLMMIVTISLLLMGFYPRYVLLNFFFQLLKDLILVHICCDQNF